MLNLPSYFRLEYEWVAGNSLVPTRMFSSGHTVPYVINLCVVMQVQSATYGRGKLSRESAIVAGNCCKFLSDLPC
jgi:hypothetical protein